MNCIWPKPWLVSDIRHTFRSWYACIGAETGTLGVSNNIHRQHAEVESYNETIFVAHSWVVVFASYAAAPKWNIVRATLGNNLVTIERPLHVTHPCGVSLTTGESVWRVCSGECCESMLVRETTLALSRRATQTNSRQWTDEKRLLNERDVPKWKALRQRHDTRVDHMAQLTDN